MAHQGRNLTLLALVIGAVGGCRIDYGELSIDTLEVGGTSNSGSAGGTQASGGNSTSLGATAGSGGTTSGGMSNGSTASGGNSNGGTSSGGSATGGFSSGGNASGGTATGGTATGGAATGGLVGEGGSSATGGSGGTSCVSTANCTCEAYGGHEYWFCTNSLSWSDANALCVTLGMALVRIDDAAENQWLGIAGTADGVFNLNLYALIGASDQAVDGAWRWPDGTQFWSGGSSGTPVDGLYSNWANQSPRSSGQANCSVIFSDLSWQDHSCTDAQPFICEGP